MGTATAHNSQFTQSLLLFVSITVQPSRTVCLTGELPLLVPNAVWNQIYSMPNEVLLFTGGRRYDETHPRELAELQCQVQGF